jgi:DNA repair protein RAD50
MARARPCVNPDYNLTIPPNETQTIIEALKYATTGELPANSKTGGGFIHDPKLRNEKELLAQVKLSFRSTSGIRMVATRNMQVTVARSKSAQKTLEGSLLMLKDGEKHSISTRVAELNQIIPQYLGVSKAVLENVIFCHQEDSLWPMSEPSKLKLKFDEIFEAMKYTLAVGSLKTITKDKKIELGQLEIIEKNAKEDKSRAEQSEKKQAELFDQIEALRLSFDKVDAECEEAQQKAREAYNNAARYEKIVAQLEGKRITLQANKESVAALQDDLKHMAESDSELQGMLDQYEERVATYASQYDDSRRQYASLKQNLQDTRSSLGNKQSEIGKHEAQREQYERQLEQRDSVIKETAKRHGIRGFDYDITDKQIADFQHLLRKMARDQNKTLERVREETQNELREAQSELAALNTKKSNLKQSKESTRTTIASNDKHIADLQSSMNQISADEGSEAILQDKKRDTEEQLQKANSEAISERYDERIAEASNNARVLEDKKERLTTELGDATKLARESASIDYARSELQSQQHSLETMKKVHNHRISQLVDADWDPATLETSFQRVASEKSNEVKEATSRRDIAQTKLDNINFQLSSQESQLKKARTELLQCEKIVKDSIQRDDISEFDETLQQLEEEYETSSSDNARIEAQIEYFRQCLKTAEQDNTCRLCARYLQDDKSQKFSVAGFMEKLHGIVAKAEKNMEAGNNVEELLEELEAARNAKPSYELAIRLRNSDIPAIESDITRLTAERETVNKQLEEQDIIVHDLEAAKQEVDSLAKNVHTIARNYTEILKLETQVKDLAQKQKAAGLSRGIDAIQTDLKSVSDESRNARAALEQLTSDRDQLRNLVATLELRVRDIIADLNHAQSKLKEKRALADRIEDFKTDNNKQRESMRGFDKSMDALVPEIEQAQYKYDDINRRGNERVQRIQDEASALSDSVRQLDHTDRDINEYIDRGGPRQLEDTRREIGKLQDEIASIDADMLEVTRKVKKIEDTMRDTETTKRAISDNLRYRKAMRALERLEIEIDELEQNGAERDKDHHEAEARHWDVKYHQANTDKITVERDMKNKDEHLQELIQEYENIYQDAAKSYREAHIKVETTKAAVEDLRRYYTALEKAIMQYHLVKMADINKIIGELWRNAYQGTDVDTVRIVSDTDVKGNKSFNYRVVMVKQDVEMDMRGRCSAGQKVLASIIIRLALAECFGSNCGLIALDEPTTNLDQQNIKGLAESLSQIIQVRRKQANFQLLVITHDEQFLREMNCADYTDVYWRVGRDQNQESFIERQNIAEVCVFFIFYFAVLIHSKYRMFLIR